MSMTPVAVYKQMMASTLFGNILAVFFWGVTTVQATLYYRRFPKDPLLLRCVITALCIFQALQVIILTIVLHANLVARFGFLTPELDFPWVPLLGQVIGLTVSVVTQACFVYRVHQLSRSVSLCLLLSCLVFIQLGFGSAFSVLQFLRPQTRVGTSSLTWLVMTWIVSNSVADVAIGASMSFLLMRRHTGLKSSDIVITRLIIYSVNTGVFTCLVSIAFIFLMFKEFPIYAAIIGGPYPGIYAFALLSNLHARSGLTSRRGDMIRLRNMDIMQSKNVVISVTKEDYQQSCYDGPAEIGLDSRILKLFPAVEESRNYFTSPSLSPTASLNPSAVPLSTVPLKRSLPKQDISHLVPADDEGDITEERKMR